MSGLTQIKETLGEIFPHHEYQEQILAEDQHRKDLAMREECPEAVAIWHINKINQASQSRSPLDCPF
jgi:hypothetical protein